MLQVVDDGGVEGNVDGNNNDVGVNCRIILTT